jgi:SNF2 family DNA or RNA helicase
VLYVKLSPLQRQLYRHFMRKLHDQEVAHEEQQVEQQTQESERMQLEWQRQQLLAQGAAQDHPQVLHLTAALAACTSAMSKPSSTGGGSKLFKAYQTLLKLWNHPQVLELAYAKECHSVLARGKAQDKKDKKEGKGKSKSAHPCEEGGNDGATGDFSKGRWWDAPVQAYVEGQYARDVASERQEAEEAMLQEQEQEQEQVGGTGSGSRDEDERGLALPCREDSVAAKAENCHSQAARVEAVTVEVAAIQAEVVSGNFTRAASLAALQQSLKQLQQEQKELQQELQQEEAAQAAQGGQEVQDLTDDGPPEVSVGLAKGMPTPAAKLHRPSSVQFISPAPTTAATSLAGTSMASALSLDDSPSKKSNRRSTKQSPLSPLGGAQFSLASAALSGKTELLLHILREASAKQEKVLIFSQSLPTLAFLEELCATTFGWKESKHYLHLDGSQVQSINRCYSLFIDATVY